MKILNISSIIPLDGLNRENDIVIRVQDYLKKKYQYEFIVAKSLPFTPKFLGIFNSKWKKYNEYTQTGVIQVQGYDTFIYPWIMPPTSDLWLNYILIPLNIIFYYIKLRKSLLKIAGDSDLILAQNNIPDSIIAYLLAKNSHKPYLLNVRGTFNPNILNLPFLGTIYKNACNMLTHSPRNFQKLKSKINIELIPHPIEPIFFNSTKPQANQPIILISICRLLELKHLAWVLDSLHKIQEKNLQFSYHIVGDGPELQRLKMKTEELKLTTKVIFHGHLNHYDVKNLLHRSHIFIMPSYPETLGRSFLEAAASNCLVIGHKNTGVDGLLEHYKSAIFVDNNTLHQELQKVFDNFSEKYLYTYTDNARQIVNNLTWKAIGEKYNRIYQNTKIKPK